MDVSETATESGAEADQTSDPEDMTEAKHIRIAVLGKTGTGKSSLAQTILGEPVFEIDHTANSGTSRCQKATKQVDEGSITLIDTPGFFDNRRSDEELKSEIIEFILESSDGLDAFLLLFKVEKFTKQENEVVLKMQQLLSEEAFKHTVVVFTHSDQLPDDMKIEEFVSKNQYLCDLLKKCENRCHIVDNKYWNNQQHKYRNNQVQVKKLLNTVKEMVESVGRYTNEMLKEVKGMIKQEVERITRSLIYKSLADIWKQAKRNVSDKLKKAAGITTGVLLGALLGVPCMVAAVISALQAVGPAAAVVVEVAEAVARGGGASAGIGLGVAAGVCSAAGAVVGGYKGYQEADEADSVEEAVKNTAEAVVKPIKEAVKKLNRMKLRSSEEEMLLTKKKIGCN